MTETPQQYTQRILGYVQGQETLAVQRETAKTLARLIEGVPDAALRARPRPGRWSASEILAHLADAEIVGAYRIRVILGSPGAAVAAYDQDAWAAAGHYDARDPRQSLELFRVVREANLALLESLAPEEWQRYGVHAERGRESIEHVARMSAGHDVNHLRQIERILARA